MPNSNQRQPARRQAPQQPARRQDNPAVLWNELNADLSRNQALFAKLLGCDRPNDPISDRFISTCYHAVWTKPDLLEVNRDSLLLAFAESAVVGLSLNPTAKEAYIEIRGGQARFRTQYQGLAKLIRRHNDVDFLHVDAVRWGDHFRQIGGSEPRIEHVACELGSEPENYDSDDAVLATYAVIKMKGATRAVHEVARRADIMKAQSKSKGKGGKPPSPAWAEWFWRMALKVPLRRLANRVDTSGEIRAAIAVEDSDTLVSESVMQVFSESVDAPRHRMSALAPKNPDELNALMDSTGRAQPEGQPGG
jgi:recombinational DNA repair protein RecT